MLRVNEIFKSIQGEGTLTGQPMTFLRLFGCNLDCKYCDTDYSRKVGNPYEELSVKEITTRIKGLPTRKGHWVCVTGGEPLVQEEELGKLVNFLTLDGIRVTIETNGSFPIPTWSKRIASWNADIKCPSSGMGGKSLDDWFYLTPFDQVKFVVSDRTDLIFVGKALERNKARTSTILVSPCIDLLPNGEMSRKSKEWLPAVASFCVEMNIIFSLQIHKVIWGAKRGV